MLARDYYVEFNICQSFTQGLRPFADGRGKIFYGLCGTLAIRELDRRESLTLGLFQGGLKSPYPGRYCLWAFQGLHRYLFRRWLL